MKDNILSYIDETIDLIKTLCQIPSPSNQEKQKAIFIKNWLEKNNAKNVYIDEANNVVYPLNIKNDDKIDVFCAHIDTVFPDLIPFDFKQDDKYLYAPGVGDDTTSVAMLMIVSKYIANNPFNEVKPTLIVFNSCEEGLGNLKGIKTIMNNYKGKINQVISFDAQYDYIVNDCVGSHRYEVIVKSKGGHSYRDFNNENAIQIIAGLINSLYDVDVSSLKGNTTYNVGIVNGGTSINTIAQQASMLYEYRSTSYESLNTMKEIFNSKVNKIKQPNIEVIVNELGKRPCKENVDETKLKSLTKKLVDICKKHSKIECYETAGSTDCNMPMSLAIPGVTVGCYLGSGEHTRQEKVLIESIPIGLNIVFDIVLENFK